MKRHIHEIQFLFALQPLIGSRQDLQKIAYSDLKVVLSYQIDVMLLT